MRLTSALVLSALLAAGCGPTGALRPLFEDDPGGGGGGGSQIFQFQLPAQGAVVQAPEMLSVSGKDLALAEFRVDGVLRRTVLAEPFQWLLDPAEHLTGPRDVSITARDLQNRVRTETRRVTIKRQATIEEIQAAIDALPSTHWYEIPNTRMRSVAWADFDDRRGPVDHIMSAESGAVFDTERERLVVFGGGDVYSGNEIYVFDMATADWSRLTDPSPFLPGDAGNNAGNTTHPDGAPVSRHTYDSIEYLPPPVDRFVVAGGSAVFPGGIDDPKTYYFDFDAMTWETRSDVTPAAGYGGMTAVGPDGRLWMQGAGSDPSLTVFDPLTDTWTVHQMWTFGFREYMATGEIDPVRNLFVSVGNGLTEVWDLANPDSGHAFLVTTGATEIQLTNNPGFAYHPPSGKLVAWSGGKATYWLDLDTATWTRVNSTGAADPGAASGRGTHGRWRYVPSRDVFIVVNSVDTNVFVYRP
jgi:hypothetical protein